MIATFCSLLYTILIIFTDVTGSGCVLRTPNCKKIVGNLYVTFPWSSSRRGAQLIFALDFLQFCHLARAPMAGLREVLVPKSSHWDCHCLQLILKTLTPAALKVLARDLVALNYQLIDKLWHACKKISKDVQMFPSLRRNMAGKIPSPCLKQKSFISTLKMCLR